MEVMVNDVIRSKARVESEVMSLEDANSLPGVVAVFGEVYPDPVRVVRVLGTDTDSIDTSISDICNDVSVEFCGGTHLANTEEAFAFCLVEETAVAKGIRRITGVTGEVAQEAIVLGNELANRIQGASVKDDNIAELRKELDAAYISAPLKVELRSKLEVLQKQALEKNNQALNQRIQSVISDLKESLSQSIDNANNNVIVQTVDIGADGKASNKIVDAVRKAAVAMSINTCVRPRRGM